MNDSRAAVAIGYERGPVVSLTRGVQATLVTLDRKVRLAPRLAGQRGWQSECVGVVLAVKDDRPSRQRIEHHAAIFGNAFPHRIRFVRHWISQTTAAEPLRGLWFLPPDHQAVMRNGRHPTDRRS